MSSSNPIDKKIPEVSISLTTYNHADYIEQAIDSVLMQETDFDYELIIGEDDSTDGTRDIVTAYKEEYPDRIKLLLNERKNVIYIDGKPTGRWNFTNNLQHCKGAYIALLEGDDYWTDPKKLQKQVDFLNNHPDHSLCFHKVIFISEDSKYPPIINEPYQKRRSYSLEDLIQKNFIATVSVLYRNYDLFSDLPQWFYTAPVGDYFLHVLAAEQGKIGYIDDSMGVRRVHGSGYWTAMDIADKNETAVRIYEMVCKYFENSQHSEAARSSLHFARYRYDYAKKRYYSSIQNLVKCLRLVPGHISVYDRGLIKSILDIFVPASILRRVGRFIRSIKKQ